MTGEMLSLRAERKLRVSSVEGLATFPVSLGRMSKPLARNAATTLMALPGNYAETPLWTSHGNYAETPLWTSHGNYAETPLWTSPESAGMSLTMFDWLDGLPGNAEMTLMKLDVWTML